MPAQDLENLYLRFVDGGDTSAFSELFDRAAPDLRGLALNLAGDRHVADDLLQETFLTAIQRSDSWSRGQPVMPWLVRVLVHRARNERRQSSRRPEVDQLVRRPVPPPEDRVAAAELRDIVEQAIEELPVRLRCVVEARLLRSANPKEIAAELGITIAAMRARLRRGLQRLREILPEGLVSGRAAPMGWTPRRTSAIDECRQPDSARTSSSR